MYICMYNFFSFLCVCVWVCICACVSACDRVCTRLCFFTNVFYYMSLLFFVSFTPPSPTHANQSNRSPSTNLDHPICTNLFNTIQALLICISLLVVVARSISPIPSYFFGPGSLLNRCVGYSVNLVSVDLVHIPG